MNLKLNSIVLLLLVWSQLFAQQGEHIEYKKLYPHEDIRIEYQWLAQKKLKHGKYVFYYRNTKLVEGEYVGGKKHGKWTRYYLSGKVAAEAFYLQNKKHGVWTFNHSNGQTMAKIGFKYDKKTGPWKSWFYDGNLACELNFKNDTMVGKQVGYFPKKQIGFNQAPPLAKFETTISYTNSQPNYQVIKYFNNGHIHERYTLHNGHFVGMYESFFLTGRPWRKLKFEENGALFSIFDINNPANNDADKGNFRDGNGELNLHTEDGLLFTRTSFSQGLKDGAFRRFEEGEKLLISGFYNNGEKSGAWRFYKPRTSRKEVVFELNYIGKDTAVASIFDGFGRTQQSGEIVNEKRIGLWRSYHPVGDLKANVNYAYGFRHGLNQKYKEQKAIEHEGIYTYGLKVGKWSYYNDFGKIIFRESFDNLIQIEPSYLFSDSCKTIPALENAFYNSTRSMTRFDKRKELITLDDIHLNFNHFIHNGNYSSWTKNYDVYELEKSRGYWVRKPNFPQFIPWEIEKRREVIKDFDLGLFTETLDPKKLKVKGDRTSPKKGVAIVVLHIDEFGAVSRISIPRGIDSVWDEKIRELFELYQFWEFGSILEMPFAMSLQRKIPIELELVKRLE
jgi:antitoxin component YwqK of YwqJK toxin-antitoxin module